MQNEGHLEDLGILDGVEALTSSVQCNIPGNKHGRGPKRSLRKALLPFAERL